MNLSNSKKILIIRLSSLGDILLTTPLIRAIKNQYPQIEIHFLLKTNFTDSLKLNPYISKIYTLSKDAGIDSLVDSLKEENYDAIIDLQNNPRSALLRKRLKTKSVNFNKLDIQKFLLVRFKINRMQNAGSIPQRYSRTIDKISLDNSGLDLFTEKNVSAELKNNERYIGICPGAKHFTKRWPREYFIDLGNMLTKNGFKVVLLGGIDDKNLCTDLVKEIKNSIDLCNDDDILQTASNMQKCEAVICNDSGLMHAACAMKVPVLVFFGSTVKEFGFVPYNNKNIILENNSLKCRPCSHIGRSNCPKKHFKCMMEITPNIAFKKLLDLMKA